MTTDDPGDSEVALSKDSATSKADSPRWPLTAINSSDMFKYSAIASAVIYAGLFLGYRKYYSRLGIRPEDVGVDNSYILARSVGFIVLAAGGTFLTILMTGWFHLALKKRPWTRRHALHILAAGAIWPVTYFLVWKFDEPQSLLAGSMVAVLTVACIAMAQFSHGSRRDRAIATGGLVVAVITVLLVPVVTAIVSAYRRADLVRDAKDSTPVTIMGIPLLDVSTESVQVSWICENSQRPPVFRNAVENTLKGILVAETDTGYYIRVPDRKEPFNIVKIPQACAFLNYDVPG